jgi:soluble lytic murein transglycosylase
MQAESSGRRYGADGGLLRSSAGAMGEMQVMPATAKDPGYGVRPWQGGADDLARVGRDYRRAMERQYGGDVAKMWAAYNGGPGRVDSAIRRYGEGWLGAMPQETQDYVRRNLRAVGAR